MVDPQRGRPGEVFSAFLKLGLTSFGGPIAHIGYFRNQLVARRGWVDEATFAQLLALCQFLPGPASSQLGFCLGLKRAGWAGALAAFVAFTLPSVLLLVLFASALPLLQGAVGQAIIGGLKLVAVAVVADAVVGMARGLCPDWPRRLIALVSLALLLLVGVVWMQLAVVALGGLAGLTLRDRVSRQAPASPGCSHGPKFGLLLLAVFIVLSIGLPILAVVWGGSVVIADAFYRAGALVFGGGHVVLPLLEEAVVAPGLVSEQDFLAGYGAAQAIPGPLFSFAAYLGFMIDAPFGPVLGSVVAGLAIFLPGFLLVAGILPFWQRVAAERSAAGAVAGINAAVVGLLASALYDPIFTSAVDGLVDLAIAAVGFALLAVWKRSPLWVVVWCVVASVGVAAS